MLEDRPWELAAKPSTSHGKNATQEWRGSSDVSMKLGVEILEKPQWVSNLTYLKELDGKFGFLSSLRPIDWLGVRPVCQIASSGQ